MHRDTTPSLARATLLRILPGRAVICSPPWQDEQAAVLFDSNSGDYWVVSPLAREIVMRSTGAGAQSVEALIQHVASRRDELEDFDGCAATAEKVITELVQQGILAQT